MYTIAMSYNKTSSLFLNLELPTRTVMLPESVRVMLPEEQAISQERIHLLAHLPWDDAYLEKVPAEYQDFFSFVLPYLNARTTNVHTALSVSHLEELISLSQQEVDRDVLYAAVILHDSGWAQLSPEDIANSLDYSALAYSPQALKPKEAHATLGAKIAHKLLKEYEGLRLAVKQKQYICELVYYHDQIRPWPETPEPIEYLLLGDADRLWSYTHENFWLDTIRKNIDPEPYVQSLENALESFFLTKQGRLIARRLIAERKNEVDQLLTSQRAIF